MNKIQLFFSIFNTALWLNHSSNVSNVKTAVQAADNIDIPIDIVDKLATLGVAKTALNTFFSKILQDAHIKPEDCDYHDLRTITERYQYTLQDLVAFQTEEPEVKTLVNQAEAVLKEGDFDQAESLINQAKEKNLLAAKRLIENQNKHLLLAAEFAAQNGKLKLIQIKYPEAAKYFQEAANIIPPENAKKLADYLNEAGFAWYNVGEYVKAEPLCLRSLAIQKKVLGQNHPDVVMSLNNLLAILYKTQNKYKQAKPLFLLLRSLVIYEKVLGLDYPYTARNLNHLVWLYYSQGKYTHAEFLYQKILATYEKVLGRDHPNTQSYKETYATFSRKNKR